MKSLVITEFLNRYIDKEAISGLLLFVSTTIAIVVANSSYGELYFEFWDRALGVTFGDSTISMSLTFWINDGLMAIFFLMVGLEIKRELLYGELSSSKRAALPIVAAIGGMIIPASIYLLVNPQESASGFGIPMATDIAFTLGILMFLGKYVPIQLKIFLVSLAVVDDLGAVIIIALFYTTDLNPTYLVLSALTMLSLLLLNIMKVKNLLPYLVIGIILWIFIHDSGVHATITGILLAIAIPSKGSIKDRNFVKKASLGLMNFERHIINNTIVTKKQHSDLEIITEAHNEVQSPMIKLEHNLHHFSSFLIMPLFALANAGILLDTSSLNLNNSIFLGVTLGLIIGKPLGITLFVYLFSYFKIIEIPSDLGFNHILGGSMLAGIGFTMSIFIAHLAFFDIEMINISKIAILVASLISAILGVVTLLVSSNIRNKKPTV